MKTIYKNLIIFSTILLATSISSCKKLLTEEPKNSPYQEVFWKSARDARSAIAGNYAMLRDAVTDKENRYYMYGDAIAKSYFTIQYTGDGLEGIQTGNFTFQYNLNSLANWTKYYKTIAMSNIVMANVPKMTDTQLKDVENPAQFKNEVIGQALFIRALSYFMMVRVWGDVPLVTEAYDDPISAPQLPRSSRAAVMKQIEDDCHKAAGLLSWTYTNTGDAKVTANRGSVYALLAHLYIWRATMSDVNTNTPIMADVNSADTTITAIINRGGYRQTDTAKYSSTFIGRSPEGIFEINMSDNTLEGSNASIGTRFLNSTYVNGYGSNPRNFVPKSYLDAHFGLGGQWVWTGTQWVWMAPLDKGDVRFKNNFDLVETDRPMLIKYANVVYRNPGQKLDAVLSNNMIIFRLSDMMLLKAEIALYKNDPATATNIINSFRTRNGASPQAQIPPGWSKDDVMYEYILERGKEMFLEGHLYYDLLRTRTYEYFIDWLTEDRFKREGFYWPVDPALFKENPNLKQTSYWLGKV
jgi:hypothetical protein